MREKRVAASRDSHHSTGNASVSQRRHHPAISRDNVRQLLTHADDRHSQLLVPFPPGAGRLTQTAAGLGSNLSRPVTHRVCVQVSVAVARSYLLPATDTAFTHLKVCPGARRSTFNVGA